jgi:hypothetical protein
MTAHVRLTLNTRHPGPMAGRPFCANGINRSRGSPLGPDTANTIVRRDVLS